MNLISPKLIAKLSIFETHLVQPSEFRLATLAVSLSSCLILSLSTKSFVLNANRWMDLGHILLSLKLLVMPRRQFTRYGYLIESNPWAIITLLGHCTTAELDSHARHLETQES